MVKWWFGYYESSHLEVAPIIITTVPGFGHSPFAQPHWRFGHGENYIREVKYEVEKADVPRLVATYPEDGRAPVNRHIERFEGQQAGEVTYVGRYRACRVRIRKLAGRNLLEATHSEFPFGEIVTHSVNLENIHRVAEPGQAIRVAVLP